MEINYDDLRYCDLKIIDLRSQLDYKKNHIKNSRNILFSSLLINPSKYLQTNSRYLLICSKGFMSFKVSKILNKMG